MSDDIVARLRLWAEGVEKQKAIVLSVAITEAADEIERLRNRLLAEENVSDIERSQNEHLQKDRNNLALEIERLRAERDEARRMYCDTAKHFGMTKEESARNCGWDCFKEEEGGA